MRSAVCVIRVRVTAASAVWAHFYGVSRLRPLRRRRLMTARPLRVRILARNPCVRARLRFLG
jgi:hypothetical protein